MIHGLKTKQQNVIYFYCFTAKIVNAAKTNNGIYIRSTYILYKKYGIWARCHVVSGL